MGDCHRWPRRSTFACFVASVFMATSLAVSAPAHGTHTPVSLGRVTSKVKRSEVDLPSALRAEVVRELRNIDLGDVADRERVVLIGLPHPTRHPSTGQPGSFVGRGVGHAHQAAGRCVGSGATRQGTR